MAAIDSASIGLVSSIAHSKTLLLYLYPFDPVYSIHSALESHAQIAHDLFAAGSQLLLEFIIDRSPDLFVTSSAFETRFADLFAHSIPSRYTNPGVLAHRCRTLLLRGSWSSVAIARVVRILDSPIEVLCLHGVLNMTDVGWKALCQSPHFVKHCSEATQILMISANDNPEPTTAALLEGVAWTKLHTLIIYDCGTYMRGFARWLASRAANFPKLERIYVLGGLDAPTESDWSTPNRVEANVAALQYMEQSRERKIPWIPSRPQRTDFVVTWSRTTVKPKPKPQTTPPHPQPDAAAATASATPVLPATDDPDRDEKFALVYEPVQNAEPTPFDDHDSSVLKMHTNVQDVLEELEQQKSHEQQTRVMQQLQKEDEADQSALDSLDRMLRSTKRQLNQ